jgi:hypothetical protein
MYLSGLGITTYVFWNDAPKIRLMTHASCRSGILTYFASCAGAVPSKNSVVSVFSALWFCEVCYLVCQAVGPPSLPFSRTALAFALLLAHPPSLPNAWAAE